MHVGRKFRLGPEKGTAGINEGGALILICESQGFGTSRSKSVGPTWINEPFVNIVEA